jgi:hypothetical protein
VTVDLHEGSNTGGFAVDISADAPCADCARLSWTTRQYLTSADAIDVPFCKD